VQEAECFAPANQGLASVRRSRIRTRPKKKNCNDYSGGCEWSADPGEVRYPKGRVMTWLGKSGEEGKGSGERTKHRGRVGGFKAGEKRLPGKGKKEKEF